MNTLGGVTFTVDTAPVPMSRPRVLKTGRTYIPERVRNYMAMVGVRAREAYPVGKEPIEQPVFVRLAFYCKDKRRRDIDNLVKSTVDGMMGIVFKDDTQVVYIQAWKMIDKESPRAEVDILILNRELSKLSIAVVEEYLLEFVAVDRLGEARERLPDTALALDLYATIEAYTSSYLEE